MSQRVESTALRAGGEQLDAAGEAQVVATRDRDSW